MNLVERIKELKKKRNAVILAHNYQLGEVQDIADFTGDSFGLSVQASETKADVILFCGVSFMAETAKILSPNKTVLIPDPDAGCPMADMITADQLRELKAKHPNAHVLCYVNSSAEVKAESDVCCTSANSVNILRDVFTPEDEIIFVPDKYLAMYSAAKTGRNVILWRGFCPTHGKILAEEVLRQKEFHPNAKVLVHPECRPDVIQLADDVLSTSGMLRYVKQSPANEFIIGTEIGIMHTLKKENPGKIFYPVTELAVCPNMKYVTLAKIARALEDMKFEITLPSGIIEKAKRSLQNMILSTKDSAAVSKSLRK